MSNQIILWSMLILPWLTLFFMRKEDLKRFIPVAAFTVISGSIIVEVFSTLNFWAVRETVFPLSYTIPYIYGALPVITIWIFKFTYGRFWLYVATNLVLDLGFSFLIMPWVVRRGIFEIISITYFQGFLVTTVLAFILYGYQLWQEDTLVSVVKNSFSRPQPAVTKLLIKNKDEESNEPN